MKDNSSNNSEVPSLGLAGKLAAAFINSKLTPLIVVTSILLGLASVILLPREEEPQIKVPMIDVMVAMPGASAKEVEERATRPIEQLLWEIPGVEYVYSTSRPGQSLVIVRFKVGEEIENSLVKLNQKLQSNFDRIPPGVSLPLIKPKSIDDVPILALTLHSDRYDHLMLRRVAKQVEEQIKQVSLVAETSLIGGNRRQVRVLVSLDKLAARNLTLAQLAPILAAANQQSRSGEITTDNQSVLIETGGFFESVRDVGNVVVGVHQARPIYLRDVAEIIDGSEEPTQYVFFGQGAATVDSEIGFDEQPAVTITVAKRPGANAISVANEVLAKVETLKGITIPSEISVSITRHYGQTAAEKSNELLFHMAIAVVSVSLLILFTLGWRESIIVAVAIPATLALTLLVFYLYGFTLNRITLFALIFSIGILVDDAIVVVENIVRHRHLEKNEGRSLTQVAVEAVEEVGNPTILATFAVIFAVLPMAFVGGLMGPYMRPIPIGAGAAMFFSLLIAFIVTPWTAIRVLGKHQPKKHKSVARDESTNDETVNDADEAVKPESASSKFAHDEDFFTRLYRRVMGPLIGHASWRWGFLIGITGLLLAAMGLVGIGWVKVKMLPFDNKSEFQIILNMPEGSSLEHTARVAREMASAVRTEPEVTDYQIYTGTASPFNFNGLVRHYFMRRGANVADIQVNLVNKHDRKTQSHDIVKRVRPQVAAIAKKYGARVALAEVPPGPPVLQTLVSEIYGPDEETRQHVAAEIRRIYQETDGVVDVDWYLEADQPKTRFVIDKEKASLHGISAAMISDTLATAVGGTQASLLHLPLEKEDVPIVVELPRDLKTQPEDLFGIQLSNGQPGAPLIRLSELVRLEHTIEDKSIYHKNLMPVSYVIGDVAGAVESPVYAILEMNERIKSEFRAPNTEVKILNASQPFSDLTPSMKWDGEWHITIEVFRDLGTAFAAVLVLIYVLMVGWFRSFLTPLVVMVAIPFSLVGIMPAHGAMGAFFTATSMIGFMAGAGIVVRNAIILVDFIELRIKEGMPLAEAVVDAGAVRFRPMLLTAMAVVVGAGVILFDPIFQGLAIALMAGEIASLLISRMAVPVLYYMAYRRK